MIRKNKSFSESLIHVDLNKVLSQNIWSIKNKRGQCKNIILISKYFIKSFYESLFFEPLISNLTKEDSLVFYMRTYTRPDVDSYSGCYEILIKLHYVYLQIKLKKLTLEIFKLFLSYVEIKKSSFKNFKKSFN